MKITIYVDLVDKRHIIIRKFRRGEKCKAEVLDFKDREEASKYLRNFLARGKRMGYEETIVARDCYRLQLEKTGEGKNEDKRKVASGI
jgi:predicted DNA-binding WGR domain protein